MNFNGCNVWKFDIFTYIVVVVIQVTYSLFPLFLKWSVSLVAYLWHLFVTLVVWPSVGVCVWRFKAIYVWFVFSWMFVGCYNSIKMSQYLLKILKKMASTHKKPCKPGILSLTKNVMKNFCELNLATVNGGSGSGWWQLATLVMLVR